MAFSWKGHAFFAGDLRLFRHFSKNPRVSTTVRRNPTLQIIQAWTGRLALTLGAETTTRAAAWRGDRYFSERLKPSRAGLGKFFCYVGLEHPGATV